MPVTAALQVWNHETLSKKFDYKEEENAVKEYPLVSPVKRVLLHTIDYEEVATNRYDYFKAIESKYTVLTENKLAIPDASSSSQESQEDNANHTVIGLPQPGRVLFDSAKIKTGFQLILDGVKWTIGSGMINIGNSCYLNSTLQALFHVPAIVNWLTSDSVHREACKKNERLCIICAMADTFDRSQDIHSFKPMLINNRLRSICRHLTPGRQEDAHEFLRNLIDSMERSYLSRIPNSSDLDQLSKETTPLNQIFGGYLRNTVTCSSCHYDSTTFQHFMDLQLEISNVKNVEDSLNIFFANENLEDGYKCDACKKAVKASKKFSLEKPPPVLCIQLKPFSVTGHKEYKIEHVNQYLNLEPYMVNPSETSIYRLTSMISHLGETRSCGHYTAVGLTPLGKYYEYDDSYVQAISFDDVSSTCGYVLFYELVKEIKNESEIPFSISNNEHARISISSNSSLANMSQRSDRVLVEPPFLMPSNIIKQQQPRLKPILLSRGENGVYHTNATFNRTPRLSSDDQFPLKSSNSLQVRSNHSNSMNHRWRNNQSPLSSYSTQNKNLTFFSHDSHHAKKRHRDDDDRDWEMEQRRPKKTQYGNSYSYKNNSNTYNRGYDYNSQPKKYGAQENNYHQYKSRNNSHSNKTRVQHKLFQQRKNYNGHNYFSRRN